MKKDPWLAASLNFIFPGAGYFYLGENKAFASILLAITTALVIGYTIFYFTSNDFVVRTILSFFSTIIPALFAVDAYKRAAKALKQKEKKGDLRDKKSFRYTFVTIIVALLILNLFLGSSVLQILLGAGKYISLNSEMVVLNQPLFDLINNATLVGLGATLLAIPYVANKLKNKTLSLKSLFLICTVLFSSMMAISTVDDYYRTQADPEKQKETKKGFNANDLVTVVNEQRHNNGTGQLTMEPSTCMVAKAQLDSLIQNGPAIMSDNAHSQRTIDKALGDGKNFDVDLVPDYYTTYYTYQEDVTKVIEEWESYEENDIFSNKNYTRVCAAVKNGYGIVVLGEYETNESISNSVSTPADKKDIINNLPGQAELL